MSIWWLQLGLVMRRKTRAASENWMLDPSCLPEDVQPRVREQDARISQVTDVITGAYERKSQEKPKHRFL